MNRSIEHHRCRRDRLSPARLRGESGLSLIEVVVAAGLIGLALMPVAYIQSSGTRTDTASYGVLAASALALDLEDRVRVIPYSDPRLTATSGYVAPDTTLSNANPLASNGSTWSACAPSKCGYTRQWQITDNSPIAKTKRIDVQVIWSEYGITRTFTLSTIKAVG